MGISTTTTADASEIDAPFERLIAELEGLPALDIIAAASRFERRLAAVRLSAAAKLAGGTGDLIRDRRQARTALRVPGASARSVNTDARRAASVANNREVADRLAAGDLGPESIDALGRAADNETGAIPAELVEAAVGLNPDQVRRCVDRYLEDSVDGDAVDERYRLQREHRRIRRYRVFAEAGRPDMAGLGIEGPDAEIDRLLAELNSLADAAYVDAGGRDTPVEAHESLDHRRYDASLRLLGVSGGQAAGTSSHAGRGRPTVVITVDADRLVGGSCKAQMVGSGPISDELLHRWLADADLAALVTGVNNAPLWLGRTRRGASSHQFLALAVRDKGCVLCSAPIGRCAAHHLTPWTSPGKGCTDVDAMALLCQSCHRDLHHRNHTLYRRRSSAGTIWASRPATPEETPAPKPALLQRE